MRVQADAAHFLRGLEDGSVGLLITDPPWALQGAGRFSDVAPYQLLPVDAVVEKLRPAQRAMRKGAHLYAFAPCGDELREFMVRMAADGWQFQRILAWEKGRAGLGAYQNAWEPVLIFSNGKAAPYRANGQFKSLQKWPRPCGRTAKPWQIYKVFMEMSSDPGDLVVDPFAGTNPLRKAAEVLQPARRWMAADLETAQDVEKQVRTADRTSKGRVKTRKAAEATANGHMLLHPNLDESGQGKGA